MKSTVKSLTVLALLFAAASTVQAGFIDLRAGVGMSAADPQGFQDQVENISGSELNADNFETINIDAVLRLPVLPITLGLRYETAMQDQTSGADEWKLNVENISVLASWRIINSKIYVGPMVSIGYPWAKLDYKDGVSSVSQQIDSSQLSYSGGLEAGIYLGPFLVGAEAGYKSIELKGASGDAAINSNVNLDGFYGKAMIGLTFL